RWNEQFNERNGRRGRRNILPGGTTTGSSIAQYVTITGEGTPQNPWVLNFISSEPFSLQATGVTAGPNPLTRAVKLVITNPRDSIIPQILSHRTQEIYFDKTPDTSTSSTISFRLSYGGILTEQISHDFVSPASTWNTIETALNNLQLELKVDPRVGATQQISFLNSPNGPTISNAKFQLEYNGNSHTFTYNPHNDAANHNAIKNWLFSLSPSVTATVNGKGTPADPWIIDFGTGSPGSITWIPFSMPIGPVDSIIKVTGPSARTGTPNNPWKVTFSKPSSPKFVKLLEWTPAQDIVIAPVPGSPTNQQQEIYFPVTPTVGTNFFLSYGTEMTGPITYSGVATTDTNKIIAELEKLLAIDSATIATGGLGTPANPWKVTITLTNPGMNVSLLESCLPGTAGIHAVSLQAMTLSTTLPHVPTYNQPAIQPFTTATFDLGENVTETATLLKANAQNIQNQLQGITTTGTALSPDTFYRYNVTVTGNGKHDDPWRITFKQPYFNIPSIRAINASTGTITEKLTITPVGPAPGNVNTIQRISFANAPTSPVRFTLIYGDQETAVINYDPNNPGPTGAAIKAKLEALPGNVIVSSVTEVAGATPPAWEVNLTPASVTDITATSTSSTAPTVTAIGTVVGQEKYTQKISFATPPAGPVTFNLIYGGQTTPDDIDYHPGNPPATPSSLAATRADIETKLRTLTGITGLTVTDDPSTNSWTVNFPVPAPIKLIDTLVPLRFIGKITLLEGDSKLMVEGLTIDAAGTITGKENNTQKIYFATSPENTTSFTLTYGSNSTDAIVYDPTSPDDTAAAIKAKLEALPPISALLNPGSGSPTTLGVTGEGSISDPWVVEFPDTASGVPLI
ncbi:hypothetical protein ACFLZG_07745, partial [Thermodesulfobacteriota bacterium]